MLDWFPELVCPLQTLISNDSFPGASICVLLFVLYIFFLCFTVYLLVATSSQNLS
jgi:hypothetical protein